jgi:long-chain acyl-CoA synthetase
MHLTPDDLPLDRVYRWEREKPDRIFLTQPCGGMGVRQWSWKEAIGEARRMAAYLESKHWEPGSRIAILSRNCAWWIMSDLAIWMAGHVSVPIYPSLRAQSIRQILEHSGAKACFIGAIDEKLPPEPPGGPGIAWIAFPTASLDGGAAYGPAWDDLIRTNPPITGCPKRGENDLATIIYTSGTTGTPKGVMHRFGSLALNAILLADALHFSSEERVLSYLPLAHIFERAALEAGACVFGWYVFFTGGIETFREDLQRARPTLFFAVPRLLVKFQQGVFAKIPKAKLQRLLRIPVVAWYVRRRILQQLGLDTVRYAASGGAPLPLDLLLWFRKLGLELFEGYGMTETMITHVPRPGATLPGFVGTALEGVETTLGPDGELLIRSPMNMLGYYREPSLTAAAFREDAFFKTGDIACIDSTLQMKVVGRIKEQFKTSKGKYIVPSAIEAKLMEHPAVEGCCLMGGGQPSPFAVVVLSENSREQCLDPTARAAMEESIAALLKSVNETLEQFEQISMVVIADGPWTVANGFLTPTLKLRRSLLEALYQEKIEQWREQRTLVLWESIPSQEHASQQASSQL